MHYPVVFPAADSVTSLSFFPFPWKWASLLSIAVFVFFVAAPTAAWSANIAVTNLDDTGAGSLREALGAAVDGDTITFKTGLSGTLLFDSTMSVDKSVTFVNRENITFNQTSAADAVGFRNVAAVTLTDFLSGTIWVDSTAKAYAMRAAGALTIEGGITGDIYSTGSIANGLVLRDTTINGDVSGSITAKGMFVASALRANNLVLNNAFSGSLLALSGGVNAEVLYANALDVFGEFSGSIIGGSQSGDVYGLMVENGLVLHDDFSGSVYVSGGNSAVAAVGRHVAIHGEMSGSIVALSDSMDAIGVYSASDIVLNGGLSGLVTAEGKCNVFGFKSRNSTTINGGLSGVISATANRWQGAKGIMAGDSLTINGGLSGSVLATAENDMSAIGLFAGDSLTINGGLSGLVGARASGDYATALFGGNNIAINGGLSGIVSAEGGGNIVLGLESNGNIFISDGISGTVSAVSSGGDEAYAVRALSKIEDGTGGAVDISGQVLARAKGIAVGVSSGQGLKLNVTGAVSALDTSGAGKAYAIADGSRDGAGGWSLGASDDVVTLGDGADINGKIELAGGTNILNLVGGGYLNGSVNGGDTMTKSGSGTWTTGEIAATNLDIQAGKLQVRVGQTATATVETSAAVNNDAEVEFLLDTTVASGTIFTGLTSGGLTGTGVYSSPMLEVAVAGDDLTLTKKSYDSVATGAHRQIAASLDPLVTTATGDMAAVMAALDCSTSVEDFNSNLDQLTGVFSMDLSSQTLDMTRFSSLSIQSRMADLRTHQILLAQQSEQADVDDPDSWPMVASIGDLAGVMQRTSDYWNNGVHMRAIGRTANMETHGNRVGYDYGSLILSGGYDRVLNDGFLAGISGGYSKTNAEYKDAGESESEADSYTLGFYSSWFEDNWYVDTIVSGSYNKFDIERKIPFLGRTADADPDGYSFSAKVAGGYKYMLSEYGLTPIASLEYTRLHQGKYTETGAGAANLTVEDVDSNFLESGLGFKVDRAWVTDFGQIIPELSAMWMHEWFSQDDDLTVFTSGAPDVALSQRISSAADDSLRFGAGAQFIHNDGLAMALRYQGEVEEYAESHSFQIEALYVF
ncbi:secreted serine protease [Pseudodesulfovibrio nedwellii]|uniref:Secreted serine protease n=1 Tax=Pseudodesulfovibrio nedwellii TaxID=2973072 RepID=A0ABM8B3R6_9BACT|nr:autotransporter domain-containing protein [Pseudodesulfovibrio nedwellii]BDQ38279.1 secreted serine protease [Pseudodesulfovibrio nedwellii]